MPRASNGKLTLGEDWLFHHRDGPSKFSHWLAYRGRPVAHPVGPEGAARRYTQGRRAPLLAGHELQGRLLKINRALRDLCLESGICPITLSMENMSLLHMSDFMNGLDSQPDSSCDSELESSNLRSSLTSNPSLFIDTSWSTARTQTRNNERSSNYTHIKNGLLFWLSSRPGVSSDTGSVFSLSSMSGLGNTRVRTFLAFATGVPGERPFSSVEAWASLAATFKGDMTAGSFKQQAARLIKWVRKSLFKTFHYHNQTVFKTCTAKIDANYRAFPSSLQTMVSVYFLFRHFFLQFDPLSPQFSSFF